MEYRLRLDERLIKNHVIVTNKSPVKKSKNPQKDGSTPQSGYPFADFWANCYTELPRPLRDADGIQQLVQSYYFGNGSISAKEAARRIQRLLLEQQA